jgi:hypothetical protein
VPLKLEDPEPVIAVLGWTDEKVRERTATFIRLYGWRGSETTQLRNLFKGRERLNVRLELTFFLPCLLPKDKSWRNEPIFFETESLRVGILVLPESRAANAPKPVEGFSVQNVDDPGVGIFQITTNPFRHFYEALSVAVFGQIAGQLPDEGERARFINAGITTASKFINLCKVLVRDEQISFPVPKVSPQSPHLDGLPYCETWFDNATGMKLADENLDHCYSQYIYGKYSPLSVKWDDLLDACKSKPDAPIDILMLLEAKSAFIAGDDRKSILFAAMAVEISSSLLLRRRLTDQRLLKQLETMDIAVWERYLDAMLKIAGLPSLKDSDSDLFSKAGIVFRVRNKIAHEGIAYLEKDSAGQPKHLSRRDVWPLILTAERVIDWLGKISP